MLVDEGKWLEATNSWSVTEDIVEQTTNGVNFYNILQWGAAQRNARPPHWEKLSSFGKILCNRLDLHLALLAFLTIM